MSFILSIFILTFQSLYSFARLTLSNVTDVLSPKLQFGHQANFKIQYVCKYLDSIF